MSFSDIPGWFGFASVYDQAIAEARDGDEVVEVGVAFGRSLAYLARRVIDSGKNIKIWAIDPWWDTWWTVPDQYPVHCTRPTWGGEFSQFGRDLGGPFSAFVHCMRAHAPEELERVNVLRCKSSDAAKIVGLTRMVLIDASHNYEDVVQDIAIWKPHMLPGGILAGDDFSEVDFPGVCRAVREAFGSGFEQRGTTWLVRT
jgi:hypothetical protein